MRSRPPVRRGLPVLGSLLEMERDRFGFFTRLVDEVGPSSSFFLGPQRVDVFTGPAEANEILVEKAAAFTKGPVLTRIARPFLGDGLLSSAGTLHAARRGIVKPALAQSRLHAKVSTFARNAAALCDEVADDVIFDVDAALLQMAVRNAGAMLFSRDLGGDDAALGAALREGMAYIGGRVRNPLSAPWSWPTPANRRAHRALERIDALVFAMIDRRDEDGDDPGDIVGVLRVALAQGAITREGARHELVTLFLAGVETVAAAMSWTLALLLQHPAVLADVVDEARGFMLGPDGSVPALPRLSACIDEALRLFPPAHSVGRRAIADVDVSGFFVPQGSVVLLSLVAMHRRADLWPEPARFDPDRFVTTPRPAGYLPFGVGLRGCIGRHMALLEARVCLAVLLQRVAWTPTSTTLPPCDTVITIRPRGGLWVRGRRRAVEG